MAPGLSSRWAAALCITVLFAVVPYWMNVVRRRQIEALADSAPSIVVLSPEECRSNIARQIFFGHPKIYAVLGTLLIVGFVWMICSGDPSPYKLPALLVFLPSSLYVLRAWRLIFSAAAI